MKSFFMVILTVCLLTNLSAQEFGEVSDEELKMTSCPEDPDADAVLLLDLMDMQINKRFEIHTAIHQRYKVLTEEGKKYADIKIPYYYEDQIYDIEAVAYSPDGEEYELDDDNIFEEEIKHTKIKSFAIPGVEVGSVIEYKFKMSSKVRATLKPWYFQSDCFTKYNRFSLILAPGFFYSKIDEGCDDYEIKMLKEDVRDPDNFSNKVVKFSFVAKNMPPVRDEPYIDNLSDKKARMYLILKKYHDLYNDIKIGQSWDDVAKFIYPDMSDYLEEDDLSLTETQRIIKDQPDDISKAKAIYKYVRDEIKQGEFTWYTSDDFKGPEDLIEAKKGGTMEKNILLINMLRNAGFKAMPVLISTRANGKFIYDFCNLDQFNSLICYLPINNENYFLSTNLEYLPFGSLPYFMDVDKGLLVTEDQGVVVKIMKVPVLNRIEIKTQGSIDEDGNLKAESEFELRGYPAYNEREEQEKDSYEEYINDKVKELSNNAVVDTFYYSIIDSTNGKLKLNINYSIPEYVDLSQDMAYMKVPLFTNLSKNPFVRQKRNFSVDFSYKIYTSEKANFKLPKDFNFSDKPERISEEIPACTYRRTYYSGKNSVECSRSFNRKKRTIETNLYKDLRKLYEDISSADQEEIVLTKSKQNVTGN